MKLSLLEHVVCPLCRRPLHLKDAIASQSGEILWGRLYCKGTPRHLYPITEGVPQLLIQASWSRQKRQTERSFSAKWLSAPRYREITGRFYIRWYLQRYGFNRLEDLRSFLKGKRFILDAGTGTGRDAQLYSKNSRAQVFGIDISEGIFTAYQDLKKLPNLHLIRADLTRLPFRDLFFDFISCDQVLHHTPEPKASLRLLLKALRPKSPIAFYLYKKKGPIREFCDDYLRRTTNRMPEKECRRFAEAITKLGRSLAKAKTKVRIPENIPLLKIRAGTYDLQRFFHWNFFKCFWNPTFDYKTNILINLDWYHPYHAHRYDPPEIMGWCRELNLRTRRFNVIESGISVLAVKP